MAFFTVDGEKMLNFASKDYLGLASDPVVKQLFRQRRLTRVGVKQVNGFGNFLTVALPKD